MKANKTNNDSWVAKTFDSEGLVSYATFCSCGGHDLVMQLRYDKEDGIKDLTFYTTEVTWEDDYRNEYSLIDRIKIRVKTAWEVLTKGYIEQEAVFVFHGDEQIKDLGNKILELAEIKAEVEPSNYIKFKKECWKEKGSLILEDAYNPLPKGPDTNKPTPAAPKHKNETTIRIIDETTKESK